MLVNKKNDSYRGGDNHGIVVRLPKIVADRLVYFDHNAKTGAWVIRDFIGGVSLDSHHATPNLLVAQIEADADYDEHPPWYNVENKVDWEKYLTLRTTAVFDIKFPDLTPANAASRQWKPLP